MLTTGATDGVAIDDQRVQQHLGMAAVGVGALCLLTPVMNQRAVAVRPTGYALAAFLGSGVLAHDLFIALAAGVPR